MTTYTRATRDGIRGVPVVSNGWAVQWISLTPGSYSPTRFRPVPDGVRSLIFLESGLDAAGYRDILVGKWDDRLYELADTLPDDAIVRWDHEMSSPPNEWRTWGQVDPELYVRVWRYVTDVLGSHEYEKTMFWCPSGHKVDARYYPGGPFVSHVGFTSYELGFRLLGKRIPAPTLWRKPLAAVRAIAPGVPIIVGETGSLDDDTGDRLPWLRSVRRVKGVEIVVYFDVDMTIAEDRDWRMNGQMLKEWRWLAKYHMACRMHRRYHK